MMLIHLLTLVGSAVGICDAKFDQTMATTLNAMKPNPPPGIANYVKATRYFVIHARGRMGDKRYAVRRLLKNIQEQYPRITKKEINAIGNPF